jgi:hypothetical protein
MSLAKALLQFLAEQQAGKQFEDQILDKMGHAIKLAYFKPRVNAGQTPKAIATELAARMEVTIDNVMQGYTLRPEVSRTEAQTKLDATVKVVLESIVEEMLKGLKLTKEEEPPIKRAAENTCTCLLCQLDRASQ